MFKHIYRGNNINDKIRIDSQESNPPHIRYFKILCAKKPTLVQQVLDYIKNDKIETKKNLNSGQYSEEVRKGIGSQWENEVSEIFPATNSRDEWLSFIHGIIGTCIFDYLKANVEAFDAYKMPTLKSGYFIYSHL